MIPAANPRAQYQHHKTEIDRAVSTVMDGGQYILGEEVRLFENDFASYNGVRSTIGTGSGTEALHVALAACGIGAGDEVITVSHTAVATVAAIAVSGATPVLVDITPDRFTMDPEKIEGAITPRTKAIMPVHLYGQPADLTAILDIARRRGLRVIEDCAQAHGALYEGKRVGSWGDIGCFSFYPTKNLGALGDGGALISNDPSLTQRARLVREYGWVDRISQVPGWNSRLDTVQAAALRVKLRYLDESNVARKRLAALYQKLLAGVPVKAPTAIPGTTHVFHLYVIRTNRRDALQAFLKSRDIGTLIHYPLPVHLQPAYKGRLAGASSLQNTERVCQEILSLPMYPELPEEDVARVAEAIRAFFG